MASFLDCSGCDRKVRGCCVGAALWLHHILTAQTQLMTISRQDRPIGRAHDCGANWTMRPSRSGDRRGVTLMELIIVVALISVFSAIALPGIKIEHIRIDAGLRELAVTLNAMQRESVVRQHDVVVSIDVDRHWIEMHRDLDNDLVRDEGEDVRVFELHEGVAFGGGGADVLEGYEQPVSFSAHPVSDLATVVFHRNGAASEEGVIYLTSRAAAGASKAEHGRAVRISRGTGRVACFSYKGGAWEESC